MADNKALPVKIKRVGGRKKKRPPTNLSNRGNIIKTSPDRPEAPRKAVPITRPKVEVKSQMTRLDLLKIEEDARTERLKAQAALVPIASKINGQVILVVSTTIQAGAGYKAAAQKVGVTKRTLYGWLKRGFNDPKKQDDGGVYRELYEKCMEAEGNATMLLTGRIMEQAKTDWRAGAWLLSNMNPKEFGRKNNRVGDDENNKGGQTNVFIYLPDNGRDRTASDQPQILEGEVRASLSLPDNGRGQDVRKLPGMVVTTTNRVEGEPASAGDWNDEGDWGGDFDVQDEGEDGDDGDL
jgi:transposase-like protein